MNRLVYRTIDNEVNNEVYVFVEEERGEIFLYIQLNGETIAKFDISIVWDMLKGRLSSASTDIDTPVGIQRRIYEAQNIPRLSREFIDNRVKNNQAGG